ncbi:glycosyltransferase [Corynebacterium cystitidis]|uniref:Putative rhamnosyl transferase n=1 Tax=Corynebacterium cystitidis DSM 20524 TaxID=1121357 RepID=A0A1H9WAY3_9CORY|nr:glycosyltransferase [Corynebacterium cystitidis]WJY82949.1 hypothetical protein CCYS_10185 [Corynebacterium cystitidis DSM 20524]SES30949.1 Putative rhamnosyl transferase [Corynebacterium cystitidis DSM 20524]SNV68709.1 Protein of uncharacterised function (DUF3118) [Corynebacterium cystitidis]
MSCLFVGHTRYSLFSPDSPAWRASSLGENRSVEDYRNYLFHPDRLEFRDWVFTQLSVPALAAAAQGHRVIHVVSYSASLPEKFKQSLHSTAEKYPLVRLDEVPDGAAPLNPATVAAQEIGPGEVFAKYRLDDDDILSQSYFTMMQRYVDPRFVGMVVSLPAGIESIYSGKNLFNLRQAHVPMHSMGLLSVCKLNDDGSVTSPNEGPHDLSDRYGPVIIDSRELSYFRLNHLDQDNVLRYGDQSKELQMVKNLDKFPLFDHLARLRRQFPTVSQAISQAPSATDVLIDDTLGEGLHLEFTGNTSGVTLFIEGTAPEGIQPRTCAVAYLIEGEDGRFKSVGDDVAGVGRSPNPRIGHFQYVTIPGGEFSTLTSIFLADGEKVRALRLLALQDTAREVAVSKLRVVHDGEEVHLIEPGRFNGLKDSQKQAKDVLAQVAYHVETGVLPRVAKLVTPLVGTTRAQAITPWVTRQRWWPQS